MRDDERCGRSREVRTPELIGQMSDFMDKDRRVSIETISGQFDVSMGTVHTIIDELLRELRRTFRHSPSNRVCGISTRTMHQSTTPSL